MAVDLSSAIDDGDKKYPRPWGYLAEAKQRRWWYRARVHVTGGPVIAFAGKNMDGELVFLFFCDIKGAIGPTPYVLHSQRTFQPFLFPTKAEALNKIMDNRFLVRASPTSLDESARVYTAAPDLTEEDWIHRLWQLVFEKGSKDLYLFLQYPTSCASEKEEQDASGLLLPTKKKEEKAAATPATRASLDYSRFACIEDSDDDTI